MIKKDYDKNRKLYEFFLKLGIPILNDFILKKIYDRDFFLEGETLKQDSAAKVAEVISRSIDFHSVFDIGCGMGIYLEQFRRIGKETLGCDFSVDGLGASSQSLTIFQADATKPISLNRKYDLLICFEVAEHILNKHSHQLVKNCTKNGRTILFTAAPVGQGGVGHINEHPYEFWISLFKKEGFSYDIETSASLRTEMKNDNVVFWIANNLMLFRDCRI